MRRDSFETCTDVDVQSCWRWAEAGFFYSVETDRVRCYVCNGEINEWKRSKCPVPVHKFLFPHCPLINGMKMANVQSGEELKLERACHPLYVEESTRFGTFKQWKSRPECLHVYPTLLAKAGFFYLRTADKCTCFYCGGTLQGWEPTDEPWCEHAKHFPSCSWLVDQRGYHFIEHVQRLSTELAVPSHTPPPQQRVQRPALPVALCSMPIVVSKGADEPNTLPGTAPHVAASTSYSAATSENNDRDDLPSTDVRLDAPAAVVLNIGDNSECGSTANLNLYKNYPFCA